MQAGFGLPGDYDLPRKVSFAAYKRVEKPKSKTVHPQVVFAYTPKHL
jgi:hypothetical protein